MAPTLQSDLRQCQTHIKKTSKHLQERKRRARINAGYIQLKSIVYPCVKNKMHMSGSKLEKADILEMTLHHVKDLQSTVRKGERPKFDQYSAGFAECLGQVSHFLSSCEKVDLETRLRLLNHLADRCTSSTDKTSTQTPYIPPPKETVEPPVHAIQVVSPNVHQATEYPQMILHPQGGVIYLVHASALQNQQAVSSLETATIVTPLMEPPQPHQSTVLSVSVPAIGLLPTPPQSPQSLAKCHSKSSTTIAPHFYQKHSEVSPCQAKMVPAPETSPDLATILI